jgi:hypothetical protein
MSLSVTFRVRPNSPAIARAPELETADPRRSSQYCSYRDDHDSTLGGQSYRQKARYDAEYSYESRERG